MAVPDWAKDVIPEALHDMPFLTDTADMDALKSNLTNAAQHMGNSLRIPGPDAGDDDWTSFDEKIKAKIPNLMRVDMESEDGRKALMRQLGLPEEAKGYEAGDEHTWLADVALHAGLTKTQFGSLVSKLGEVNVQRSAESEAGRADALNTLYQEWGLAKPLKLTNINGLLKLTEAPEVFVKDVADNKADASTLKWLDSIASQFAEVAKFSKDRNNPDTLNPSEAVVQIQELMDNPEYWKTTPAAKALQAKMLDLQKAANPGAATDMRGMIATGSELQEMFETK